MATESYDLLQIDPRTTLKDAIMPGYAGPTKKAYRKRRRCASCNNLTAVRLQTFAGMLCPTCEKAQRNRSVKLINDSVASGIAFFHHEYADAGLEAK